MKPTNFDDVYRILKKQIKTAKNIPVVELTQIKQKNPFNTLIATMLSARTRDDTIIKISDKLFDSIKNIEDLEKINLKQLEKLIYPVGFYKTKANNLKKWPSIIKNQFNNKIPSTLEDLMKLPGVGRKTANIVLAVAYNQDKIGVDIHVKVISFRLGWTEHIKEIKIEQDLEKNIPKKYWKDINFLLVAHGQNTCFTNNPKCSKCSIKNYCPRIGVIKSR